MPSRQQLSWFVGIWAASIAALALLSGVLKLWLR